MSGNEKRQRILDWTPRGRDDGQAWQTWIHRYDEYDRH